MRRQVMSLSFVVCGVLLLMMGITPGSGPGTASAGPVQQQPSPRPPLSSTVIPGVDTPSDSPTAVPDSRGRITGTVIDLTTGAPAPGMIVRVGDGAVTSDSNGNYDRNGLAAGEYTVQLIVEGQNMRAEQGAQIVELSRDGLVVLHLFFRSVATTAPTATATAQPIPTALPSDLPDTAVAPIPARLPVTAAAGQGVPPGVWLVLGAFLLLMGVLLQFQGLTNSALAWAGGLAGRGGVRPVAAPPAPPRRDPTEVLANLLSTDPGSAEAPANNEALLEKLLSKDIR